MASYNKIMLKAVAQPEEYAYSDEFRRGLDMEIDASYSLLADRYKNYPIASAALEEAYAVFTTFLELLLDQLETEAWQTREVRAAYSS